MTTLISNKLLKKQWFENSYGYNYINLIKEIININIKNKKGDTHLICSCVNAKRKI